MIYTAPLSLSLSPALCERRYARHLALVDVGEAGQRALLTAHVALIGLGGLGALIAPYLAAAGVGRLTLIDFDEVSLSNLQRQPLYSVADLGRSKVEVAAERLDALNPEVAVRPLARPLEELAPVWEREVGEVDLLIDATDRFSARLLISQLSARLKCPHLYGSVNGMEGQVALFQPDGPCYRCLFPSLPPPGVIQNCSQAGVLGPAPALIGSAQALLALQHLMRHETPAQLTQLDLATLKSYHLPLTHDERCPQCHPTPVESHLTAPRSASPLSASLLGGLVTPLSANTLQKRLHEGWAPLLIDVRRADELTTGVIDGAFHVPVDVLEGMIETLKEGFKERFNEPSSKGKQEGVMREPNVSFSPNTPQITSQDADEVCDLVVYCAQGPRAERAARALAQLSPKELEALADLLPSHSLSAHLKRVSSFKLWELVGGWRAWAELRES